MSDAVRGFVLLLSVVLWLPCLRPLLDGEMSTAEAGVRYGVALLLAWGSCAVLAALVKAYTPEPEEEADGTAPGRRAEDGTAPGRRAGDEPVPVETAKAEVLVERRAQPRDDDAIAT